MTILSKNFPLQIPGSLKAPDGSEYVTITDGDGNVIETSATRRLRVALDGTQLFYDAWDSASILPSNWNTAVLGGTGTSTPTAGNEALATGTTANSFAYITSKYTFPPVAPGYIECDHQIQVTFPLVAHTYAYWGMGTVPGSPTSAAPLTDAVAFELSTTGVLNAVCFAGGTRNFIATLPAIADSNIHRYQIFFRGDNIYWVVDNIVVANIITGALGPNTNILPIMLLAGVDATGSASTFTLNSAAIYISDSSKSGASIKAAPYGAYNYTHIAAGQATTVVKSGSGTLRSIIFSGVASASNVTTIYDNTAASGTVISIPNTLAVTFPTTLFFDLAFATGLTISTTGGNGSDMTVMWK